MRGLPSQLQWLVATLMLLPACVPSPVSPPTPILGHDEWTQYFIYEAYTTGKSTSGEEIIAANECWAGVDPSFIANYRGELPTGQHVECLAGHNAAVFLKKGARWQPQFAPYRPQFESWDEIAIPANFRIDTAATFLYVKRSLGQDDIDKPTTRHITGVSLAVLDGHIVHELRLPAPCDLDVRGGTAPPGYIPPFPRTVVVLRATTVFVAAVLDSSKRVSCDPDDVYLIQTPENLILPASEPQSVAIYIGDANRNDALKVATRSRAKASANPETFAYFNESLPSPAAPGTVQRLDIPDRGFSGTECIAAVPREIGFICRPREPLLTKYVLCTYHGAALRTFVGLSRGPPLKTHFVGCEEIGSGPADFR